MTYETSVIDSQGGGHGGSYRKKPPTSAQDGCETVTVSVTNAAKAILALCAADAVWQKNTIREDNDEKQ